MNRPERVRQMFAELLRRAARRVEVADPSPRSSRAAICRRDTRWWEQRRDGVAARRLRIDAGLEPGVRYHRH